MTAHPSPGEVMMLLTDKLLRTAVLDAVTVTKVPDHGLYLVWLYVEAVRRRWSLSVAAAKPALRIVDPRRG
jgi:hypothetical protein